MQKCQCEGHQEPFPFRPSKSSLNLSHDLSLLSTFGGGMKDKPGKTSRTNFLDTIWQHLQVEQNGTWQVSCPSEHNNILPFSELPQ